MKRILLHVSILVFALGGVSVSAAQGTGVIKGQVTDESGAALPGVTVTITDEVRGIARVVTTAENGVFVVPALRLGFYTVTAELHGFQSFVTDNVEVGSGQTTHMPITLSIATVAETITVTGAYGPGTHRPIEAPVGKASTPVTTYRVAPRSPVFVEPSHTIASSRDRRNTEAYDEIRDNPFHRVLDEPLSTFAIDVDTASYSNVRRFLNQYQWPPRDAVRIEELVNYFDYDYPSAASRDPFSVELEQIACPWTPRHRLVRIAIKGRELEPGKRPNGNFVFLLDVSGSMADANKLPLVVSSMKMLVRQLTAKDRIAIVVYAGASGVVLPTTRGDEHAAILDALENLRAGGSTNGGAGIELAYKLARESFIEGGANRVLLATDGDFNVGITARDRLIALIEKEAKSGVFLTVLGFGMGNYKDGTLEQLADKGNGNHAYVDSLREARKVLVEQASGTLVTIAKDVKIQVEFNPARVSSYRLIGYENRVLADEDFNDDSKDAGEIGAGHRVTALYETVPVGVSSPRGIDPLKYQTRPTESEYPNDTELLTVKLRYKSPEGRTSKLLSYPLAAESVREPSTDFKFAAAVAAFGMLLRGSPHHGDFEWKDVESLARDGRGEDLRGYRREFLDLVEMAQLVARAER